jgi:site-specific recombinase XerD
MLPQCSHITRKRGVYYYRRRLPKPFLGEIAVSLRTKVFLEADWLSQHLDHAFEQALLHSMTDSSNRRADIAGIAKQYLRDALEGDLLIRQRQAGQVLASGWDKWASSIHAVELELDAAKTVLAGRKPADRPEIIDMLMAKHEVPEDQRQELTFAILRADVAKWETIRKRTLGEPDGFQDAQPLAANGSPVAANGSNALPAITGPRLSEILPGFLKFMSEQRVWRGQTLAQNTATYDMFIKCCGDRPVTSYERKDLAAFFDLLRGLPKLYSKSAEWKGLSLTQIVERTKEQNHERLSITTMKRHFSALGRMFDYLRKRGEYLGENPAYGFEFPDKRRDRDKRKVWEGERLTKLFASPVWTGCLSEGRRSRPGSLIIKDEKYWLPLLGLYHGNRLEEFAQLCRGDVRQKEGIWFLDINDEGDKQVKNEQSKRRVPLHPELHRLGFLDYVQQIAANTDDRIFPQLRPGGPDKKLGFFFTKWWTQYRKSVGVYEKGYDYHSFRAGVTTKLATAGVSLELRNELLGHEGTSVDERVYLKGFPLRALSDAISLVSWPEVRL